MKFAVLALTVVLVASCDGMINGERFPHQPYFARLLYDTQNGPLHGGGAIISDRHVITSPRVLIFNSLLVFVGSDVRVNQVPFNHFWIYPWATNTIAVVMVQEPFTFSQSVYPIKLPPLDPYYTAPLQYQQGMVLGMSGQTIFLQEFMHAVYMRITSQQVCLENYSWLNIQPFFCAIDTRNRGDFCLDDRGSAFTTLLEGEEILMGIATEGACNTEVHTRPSLFVNVAFYRREIYQRFGI